MILFIFRYSSIIITIFIEVLTLDSMCACVFGRNEKKTSLKKCFEGLGCVTLTPEWTDPKHRPVNVLPCDRHVVNTIFVHWYMDKNLTSEIIGTSVKDCKFHSSGVIMLIHDFTSNGYTGWIQHLAKAVLSLPEPIRSESDVNNVISVDWAAGAQPPYVQAVANARLVALEVINFLESLRRIYDIQPSSVHIVGHGLGAHIAGYVGKMLPIHKITALDPSGPYFESMPPHVRLHKYDAKLVEVVHTDAQEFGQGTSDMLGHVDYFPNGGRMQPGCIDNNMVLTEIRRDDLQLGETLSACSHKRSVKYYIEALINPKCRYTGISCNSYKEFLKGNCASCGNNTELCSSLHILSEPRKINNTQGFFFVTSNATPFCGEILKVCLVLKNPESRTGIVKGYFNVTVPQDHGDVTFLMNENHALSTLHANAQHDFVVFRTTPPALQLPARALTVKWLHGHIPCSWCTPPKINSLLINRPDQWFCPITGSSDETVGLSLEPCHVDNKDGKTTSDSVDYY